MAIQTIQELEQYYYGTTDNIYKIDAPVVSTTTGVFNAVFGKFIWDQFNQEANVFGVLPKTVWKKSGWRLATARAGSTADGGIAEAGVIPDSIKRTFQEVTNTLKTVAHNFEVSEIQQYLASVDDDAASDLTQTIQAGAMKHKEAMNQQLLRDASAQAAAATANYTGIDGFETIDRVISSDAEEDAYGGTYTGYFDIFGLDRDAATTFDSVVSLDATADRSISDSLLRTIIYDIQEAGGNTSVISTGWDTTRAAIGLYSDQLRYSNIVSEANVKISVNGIETEEGLNSGMRLKSIYSLPMIQSKDTPKDTISRMYFLDTSDPEDSGEARISLSIGKPTIFHQAGVDDNTPFVIDKFTTQVLYHTLGEIKCPRVDCQGKLRDISS
jgi:hypothetical protein